MSFTGVNASMNKSIFMDTLVAFTGMQGSAVLYGDRLACQLPDLDYSIETVIR